MSEPVGNSPRGAVPGNSHKERASQERPSPQSEEPREKLEKVVTGTVTVSKQPWYKRWARNMFAGDAQTMREYIVQEVIFPGLKTALDEIIVGGTRNVLWGPDSRHARRGGGGGGGHGGGIRARYDKMSEDDRPRRREMSYEARRTHDFNDIKLDSRSEAIDVIERMVMHIGKYRQASVADLYDLLGTTGSYADQNYGWFNLDDADVRQYRGAWLLVLPTPEPLRR